MTNPTNNEHPITPSPELVQQLADRPGTWLEKIINAYQAGADQELEACCEYMRHEDFHGFAQELRAARRPKPPSLKEQALAALKREEEQWPMRSAYRADGFGIIRRALNELPDN